MDHRILEKLTDRDLTAILAIANAILFLPDTIEHFHHDDYGHWAPTGTHNPPFEDVPQGTMHKARFQACTHEEDRYRRPSLPNVPALIKQVLCGFRVNPAARVDTRANPPDMCMAVSKESMVEDSP